MLRESLNRGYTETPEVTGGGNRAGSGFRRIVQGELGGVCRGSTDRTDGIARELHLIVDDQDVGRLQLALHEVFAVKEGQSVERGKQHFPNFVGSKGPVRKDLRERLFSIFHHDEQKLLASELAMTCVEKPNEMRM